nr:hypothetical protein [Cupriavidus sp. AcVe19-1a]
MAHTFHIHGHRWLVPGPSGVGSNIKELMLYKAGSTTQIRPYRVPVPPVYRLGPDPTITIPT